MSPSPAVNGGRLDRTGPNRNRFTWAPGRRAHRPRMRREARTRAPVYARDASPAPLMCGRSAAPRHPARPRRSPRCHNAGPGEVGGGVMRIAAGLLSGALVAGLIASGASMASAATPTYVSAPAPAPTASPFFFGGGVGLGFGDVDWVSV